jgi:hypothetical protein
VNQFIEIRHLEPLTGYEIILYNGFNGLLYNRTKLSSYQPTSTVRNVNYTVIPYKQIANSVEGVALISPNGTVVEFLSYEGTFIARNGPANQTRSVNIRVSESSNCTKKGLSLQKCVGSTKWVGPINNTMGKPNIDCATISTNATNTTAPCSDTRPDVPPPASTPVMVPTKIAPVTVPTPTVPTPTVPVTVPTPTVPVTVPTPRAPVTVPTLKAPIFKPTASVPVFYVPTPTHKSENCGLFKLNIFCPFKCGYFKRHLKLC